MEAEQSYKRLEEVVDVLLDYGPRGLSEHGKETLNEAFRSGHATPLEIRFLLESHADDKATHSLEFVRDRGLAELHRSSSTRHPFANPQYLSWGINRRLFTEEDVQKADMDFLRANVPRYIARIRSRGTPKNHGYNLTDLKRAERKGVIPEGSIVAARQQHTAK